MARRPSSCRLGSRADLVPLGDESGLETAVTEPLLACREVTKQFGALTAVNKMSFTLMPGEVLGIGGPNGAGKTTLFEAISGLNPATSGEILFQGKNITGLPPEALCHAGIARTFQLNAG